MKRSKNRNLYLARKFAPYFKPHLKVMLFDLFCASMTTLCELALPMIVREITQRATTDISTLTVRLILTMCGVYVLLRVIDTAANYYMQSIGHSMGAQIETDMRRDMFSHLQMLQNSYYDNTKIGQLMSRITTDLNDVTEFAHHFPEEIFIAIIKITVSFIILARMNLLLTLIVFVMLPLMVIFSRHFSQKMRESFKDSRHQLGELNAQVEDTLGGIRVVKSFANENVEEKKFANGNQRFLNIKHRMYANMAGFHSVTRFFDGIMYIAVVMVGALFLISDNPVMKLTASDLVAFLLYVTTLLASIRRIVEFSESFQRGMTGLERFVEVMDEPVTIVDAPDAIELTNVKGEVTFDDVTFTYAENLDNVLAHINLTVKPGESVALVGPSGGGKTTMCNLIPRFYEVTGGSVKIDGVDVRKLKLHSLRNQIGMVQQDVYLFSGSVYDNIEYGKPGATREEIIEAAKLAGAHEFILSLPEGYDTYVGERGVKLSGGQKQRISIARVFIKNPPIVIFDEATSALDNESELLVQNSLDRLMKGRTTFTIAHRLTTIHNADTILVLTEQGIVESGSHSELMAKKGVYYDLYKLYSRQDEKIA